MTSNYKSDMVIYKILSPDKLFLYKSKIADDPFFSWTYCCVFYKNKNSIILEEVNEPSTFFHNPLPNLAEKLIETSLKKETDLVSRLFKSGNTICMDVVSGEFPTDKFDNEGLIYQFKHLKNKELEKFQKLVFQIGNSPKYVDKLIKRKKLS